MNVLLSPSASARELVKTIAENCLSQDPLLDRQMAPIQKRFFQEFDVACEQILVANPLLATVGPGTAGISTVLGFIFNDPDQPSD